MDSEDNVLTNIYFLLSTSMTRLVFYSKYFIILLNILNSEIHKLCLDGQNATKSCLSQ